MKDITIEDICYSEKIARTFCKRWGIEDKNNIDDMISEAYIALCEASQAYDESKGNFKTFCYKVIQHSLSDFRHKELNYKKNISLIDSTELVPDPFLCSS